MYLATLIAASLLGQCAGGRCPAPSSGGFSFPAYRVVQPQPVHRPLALHRVKYNGLIFEVWGTLESDGSIEWSPSFPQNAANFRAAKEASKPKAAPAPTAKVEPKTATVAEPTQDAPQNFGISRDQIGKSRGYSGDVREYSAKTDVGGKLFLTVIGSKEDRAEFVRDWESNPEFRSLHDKVHFGEFDRGDWQVSDGLGYAANGKPTILIQQASGRVDYRAYDYSGGAAGVAQALRRANPNYNPEKDPGPHNVPGLDGDTHVILILSGAGLLAFLFLPRRAK